MSYEDKNQKEFIGNDEYSFLNEQDAYEEQFFHRDEFNRDAEI